MNHVHAVSWGDGENPSSGDGCGFFIVRLAVVATLILGVVWSGRRAHTEG